MQLYMSGLWNIYVYSVVGIAKKIFLTYEERKIDLGLKFRFRVDVVNARISNFAVKSRDNIPLILLERKPHPAPISFKIADRDKIISTVPPLSS